MDRDKIIHDLSLLYAKSKLEKCMLSNQCNPENLAEELSNLLDLYIFARSEYENYTDEEFEIKGKLL